jgi:hypothetical protein
MRIMRLMTGTASILVVSTKRRLCRCERKRSIGSLKRERIAKSRKAALSAILQKQAAAATVTGVGNDPYGDAVVDVHE